MKSKKLVGVLTGILIIVVAFVGMLIAGQLIVPSVSYVITARQTIPSGTHIAQVPDSWFHNAPIYSENTVVGTMIDEASLRKLQAEDAVVIQTINAGEPLRWAAIVSEGNPASEQRVALALDDPNLVGLVIPITYLPSGVDKGDCVDITVALDEVRSDQSLLYGQVAPSGPGFLLPPGMNVGGNNDGYITDTPTPTPTPTMTPTPGYGVPLAKVIVSCATVNKIIRETSVSANFSSSGDQSTANLDNGKIIAIEVIIPRQAQEFLIMASSSGRIWVSAVSPMAQRLSNGPSIGASVQDIIDLFYADRDEIAKNGTPTPEPSWTPAIIPTDKPQ